MGVVIAAGDLQAATLLQGVAAGGQGGSHRAQGALNQQGRPGETELANSTGIKGAGEGCLHIGGIVHPFDLLRGGGGGFCQRIAEAAELGDDVISTFQPLTGTWPAHLSRRPEALREQRLQARQQLAAAMPGLCVAVADTPQDILAAFDRYLALEAGLREQGGGVTIGGDERRVAFYREWLPRLAADGDAAVWLLGSVEQGEVAGLLRLRSGHIWIERHACFDPARAAHTPSLLLLLEALQHGFGTTATESRLVNLREPQPAAASVMSWYDDCIQTQRLSVWNLHSKLAPVAFLKGLGRRLRG